MTAATRVALAAFHFADNIFSICRQFPSSPLITGTNLRQTPQSGTPTGLCIEIDLLQPHERSLTATLSPYFLIDHQKHSKMVGRGTGMLGEDGIHVDMNHLKSGEVNLGTSIMAVNFKDGVILGADSRTTTGAYIANRVTDKLTKVHDTIWCCRSGSAADTQAVADIVQYYLGMYGIMNNEAPTTQTAAALFQELCYDNKDQLRQAFLLPDISRQYV
jgi:Proteasome subunit